MTKCKRMKQWVEETQMFQRIAGIQESSTEFLEKDWKLMNSKERKFQEHNATHCLIILQESLKAAKTRNS